MCLRGVVGSESGSQLSGLRRIGRDSCWWSIRSVWPGLVDQAACPDSSCRASVNARSKNQIDKRDVLSAALYPKVFDEYRSHIDKFGTGIPDLPTTAFWNPLEEVRDTVVAHRGWLTRGWRVVLL